MSGDVVKAGEVALVDLLAPAGRFEFDDLDVARVGEVGHRRVVEGQVPVLADPEAAQVERILRQQVAVAAALRLGVSETLHVERGLGVRRLDDALPYPALEACGVVRSHPDVFVHVEDNGVGPGHPFGLVHQGLGEGQLGVTRGEHHVGRTPVGHGLQHDRERLVGRCPGHGPHVGVDLHRGAVNRPGPRLHGVQHARLQLGQTGTVRDVELPGPAHREAAWLVARRFLAVTPVVDTPQLGPSVSVKLETLQPTGSFKVRGGLAAVSATLEQDPGRAVVASSAGNHGLGLAFAASKLGATVTVVVPTGASAAKVSALQQFDVRLVLHGEGYREAETHALELAADEGSRYVSPYNDPDVIAGQATLARELVEQVPDLGTVVVPCGGGGLLAGVTIGLEGTGVRVIGVESEASPSMSTALAAGGIVPIEVEPTVADGLAGNLEPGAVTVGVALSHGVNVLTVSEADIRSAMAFSASKMGLVLEGAGAVGVAALRAGVVTPDADGKQTVVLLTGRNVAPKLLSEVLHS